MRRAPAYVHLALRQIVAARAAAQNVELRDGLEDDLADTLYAIVLAPISSLDAAPMWQEMLERLDLIVLPPTKRDGSRRRRRPIRLKLDLEDLQRLTRHPLDDESRNFFDTLRGNDLYILRPPGGARAGPDEAAQPESAAPREFEPASVAPAAALSVKQAHVAKKISAATDHLNLILDQLGPPPEPMASGIEEPDPVTPVGSR